MAQLSIMREHLAVRMVDPTIGFQTLEGTPEGTPERLTVEAIEKGLFKSHFKYSPRESFGRFL